MAKNDHLEMKVDDKTFRSLSKTQTFLGHDINSLKKESSVVSNTTTYIAVATAAFSVINFGYMLGYTSLAIPQLTNITGDLAFDRNTAAWFGSIVMIGAFVGSNVAGKFLDYFGRQCGLILVSIPATIGWFLIESAETVTTLLIGRFFTGISLGMAAVAYSVYVSEISTASLRALLGGSIQVGIATGYIINASFGMITTWRYSAIIGQIIVTLLAIGMTFMPMSPYWLINNGYHGMAADQLRRLRGLEANINFELMEIESVKHKKETNYSELWSHSVRKPFIITLIVVIIQKWNGFHPILFYSSYIFQSVGVDNYRLITLVMAVSQFLGSLIGYFLASRFSRVKLLLCSSAMMATFCATAGVYFYLIAAMSLNLVWLGLISTCGLLLGFNMAWGGLPFVIMAEILPVRVRGLASGISASIGFMASFLASYTFLPLSQAISVPGAMWFFTGWNIMNAVFVFFFVPETKGKQFSEIEAMFNKRKIVHVVTEV